jgi:hypothetical protein
VITQQPGTNRNGNYFYILQPLAPADRPRPCSTGQHYCQVVWSYEIVFGGDTRTKGGDTSNMTSEAEVLIIACVGGDTSTPLAPADRPRPCSTGQHYCQVVQVVLSYEIGLSLNFEWQ